MSVLCWSPVVVLAGWFVLLLVGVDGDTIRTPAIGMFCVSMALYIRGTQTKLRAAARERERQAARDA